MDTENAMGQAIDRFADGDEAAGQEILEAVIAEVRGGMAGNLSDTERHITWGRCLELLGEHRQALLRYESVLGLDPNHEGALWAISQLFLNDVDHPDGAVTVLKERLLKIRPNDPRYKQALSDAEAMLRIKARHAGEWDSGDPDEGKETSSKTDEESSGPEAT